MYICYCCPKLYLFYDYCLYINFFKIFYVYFGGDELVKPPGVDEYCLVSGMVALMNRSVAGQCGLSSPRAWASVVWAASVKLSEMDVFLVMAIGSIDEDDGDVVGVGVLSLWP